MSLLDEAKKFEHKRAYRTGATREEVELILAFLKNEITYTQARKVLRIANTGSGVYAIFVSILREGIENGWLKASLN